MDLKDVVPSDKSLERLFIKHIREVSPFEKLGMINTRIQDISDCIKVVDNNLKELTTPGNRARIDLGQPNFLYEYLILEIHTFYDHLRRMQKDPDLEVPELPDYMKSLDWFRNSFPGHMDKYERLPRRVDWEEKWEKIMVTIGLKKIILDYDSIYKKCKEMFGDKMFPSSNVK